MKARDIVGRRVVAIRQERFHNDQVNEMVTHLCSLTLDNGVVIVLHAEETDTEPYVYATVNRPKS